MDNETKDYAEHLLERLNSKDVEILQMRYWHNMTCEEIGKEMGVSGSYISIQIFRILKKCRGFIYREVDKPRHVLTQDEYDNHQRQIFYHRFKGAMDTFFGENRP